MWRWAIFIAAAPHSRAGRTRGFVQILRSLTLAHLSFIFVRVIWLVEKGPDTGRVRRARVSGSSSVLIGPARDLEVAGPPEPPPPAASVRRFSAAPAAIKFQGQKSKGQQDLEARSWSTRRRRRRLGARVGDLRVRRLGVVARKVVFKFRFSRTGGQPSGGFETRLFLDWRKGANFT